MSDTLYIKMDRSVEVTTKEVTIGDIAKLECQNKAIVNKIKPLKVLKINSDKNERYIISIMKVIEMIDKECVGIQINNIGETDCIIEIKKPNSAKKIPELIKVACVCMTTFFGAGFAIMSFDNDISIHELFNNLCMQIAGDIDVGVEIMELMFSIGLAVGIVIFYNHFGAKKITKDPTPIEVEMRNYENEINTTLIDGHNRKDGKLDVK